MAENKYPTPEQIIKKATNLKVSEDFSLAVCSWIAAGYYKNWSSKSNDTKSSSLKSLIERLVIRNPYGSPNLRVLAEPFPSCYIKAEEVIIINNENPSIITALHEFAHFLTGNGDELFACAWSVVLFKKQVVPYGKTVSTLKS